MGRLEFPVSCFRLTSSENAFRIECDPIARKAHQETVADLGVHAALHRRDQLQRHCQGGKGDPAYGGETL